MPSLTVKLTQLDVDRICELATVNAQSRSEWLRAALALAMSRPDLVEVVRLHGHGLTPPIA